MAGPTTSGLAALIGGEGWRYVGETDEPALGTGWENLGGSWPALAFRLREVGQVDVVGAIRATMDAPDAPVVFAEDYRPNEYAPIGPQTHQPAAGGLGIVNGVVTGSGTLSLTSAAGILDNDIVYISGSFPLDTAAP